MRARKKKNTIPRLERCEEYLSNKVEIKENVPLRLEIGCGKGKFITEVATKPENKDIAFYAVEKVPDVMVMAAEKAAKLASKASAEDTETPEEKDDEN
jgi:tRNA (guanine-N7-)-methyltransferase